MIVQPPNCATPADVGPSIHFVSRPITVDHHSQRVDILPRLRLQCPIACTHEESADAPCPLHVSNRRTLHSSSTFFDTELNVWVFSGDEHQFAHNRLVRTVFSGTKQIFLIRNSRFRSHTKRMHKIASLQTSTGHDQPTHRRPCVCTS